MRYYKKVIPSKGTYISSPLLVKPTKTELKNLSEEEYNHLNDTGLLWEIYPEATGRWEDDVLLPCLDKKYKRVRKRTEKTIEALPKVTLEEAIAQIALYEKTIKLARKRLAEIGKLKSCPKEVWEAICQIKL